MTPRIYLRSPRPDGYYEGVEPVRTKPDYTSDWEGYKKWHNEIYSLPVTYLIHPELGKANGVGWLVKEWEEGYERAAVEGQWKLCTKEEYDEQSPALWYRKIIVGKKVDYPREGLNELPIAVNYLDESQPADKQEGKDDLTGFKIPMASLRYALEVLGKETLPEFEETATDEEKWYLNELSKAYSQGAEDFADEEYKEDHRRLVREMDEALNGKEGMAKQASLCDLVSQVKLLAASHPVTDEAKEIERLKARVKELENKIKFLENQGNAY